MIEDLKYEINLPEDTIIDLSQPGIIHYIYPSGRDVPMNMMDPNLGGNFKNVP